MEQIDERGRSTTVIHFVFQVGPERVACMPHMTEFHSTPYHPNYQRTNDPSSVTCPGCRKTDVYKRARGISG